jgi:hypothetical protein
MEELVIVDLKLVINYPIKEGDEEERDKKQGYWILSQDQTGI